MELLRLSPVLDRQWESEGGVRWQGHCSCRASSSGETRTALPILLRSGDHSLRRNARARRARDASMAPRPGGSSVGGLDLRNLLHRWSPGWLGRPGLRLPKTRAVAVPQMRAGSSCRIAEPRRDSLPKLWRRADNCTSRTWGIIGVMCHPRVATNKVRRCLARRAWWSECGAVQQAALQS